MAGDSQGPKTESAHGHTTIPQSRGHALPNTRLLEAEARFQREVENVLHPADDSSDSDLMAQ